MLTPQQGSICRKDKTAFCTCDMAGAPQRPLRFLCSLMCPFLFRQICNRTVCSPVCKLNGPALRCDCAEQGRFVSAKIKI